MFATLKFRLSRCKNLNSLWKWKDKIFYKTQHSFKDGYCFHPCIVFLDLHTGFAAFVLGSSQIWFIVEHPLEVAFPSEIKEYQIYLQKNSCKITSIICWKTSVKSFTFITKLPLVCFKIWVTSQTFAWNL